MQQKKHYSKGSLPLSVPAGSRQLQKPFSKQELSEWVGLSMRTIEMEVAAGRLRACILSKRTIRFLPADVDRWLNKRASIEAEEQVPA